MHSWLHKNARSEAEHCYAIGLVEVEPRHEVGAGADDSHGHDPLGVGTGSV